MEFFIVIIVGIVILIWIVYDGIKEYISEKKRIEGLRSVAQEMDFSFSARGELGPLGGLRGSSHLFSQGGSRNVTNVMQKTVNDIDVTIMDYKYSIPSGKSSSTRRQTVILFHSHTLRLPSFTLRPEANYRKIDVFRKIDGVLGYQDIDFSSDPIFSRQYLLQGSDEEDIRGIFNNNILSYYRHSELATEGNGEQLLFYKPSERLSPEKIPSFMEQGLQVFELFQTAHQEWTEVLQRLEERKKHPDSPASLIVDLANENWGKQFIARHTLAAWGGEVVEPLKVALDRDSGALFRETAVWVLKRVVEDTTTRLATNAPHLLCSRCLVRCHSHQLNLSWWQGAFTYYGCRVCRQSREFFDWPGEIVAVLDQEMNAEQAQAEGVLRVNWLKRGAVFDFDRVEIVKSNDEQVERFAVQAGNDTDDFRYPHYRKMVCEIAPDCFLSENTLRILKRTFGEVQHQA